MASTTRSLLAAAASAAAWTVAAACGGVDARAQAAPPAAEAPAQASAPSAPASGSTATLAPGEGGTLVFRVLGLSAPGTARVTAPDDPDPANDARRLVDCIDYVVERLAQ